MRRGLKPLIMSIFYSIIGLFVLISISCGGGGGDSPSGGSSTTTTVVPVVPGDMVLIPAGSFLMGDNIGEGHSDERPVHTVTLSAFYLDKYEVTFALWDEVVQWAIAHGYSGIPYRGPVGSNNPITLVDWSAIIQWLNARSEKEGRTPVYYKDVAQTQVYRELVWNEPGKYITNDMVKWTANGYRLPTEAEWEYAYRAGTTTRFYTGDSISTDQANYDGRYPWFGSPSGQYRGNSIAVGSFSANPWGLYDMAGNIREWTWDCYDSYSSSAVTNPKGPDRADCSRVRRGGSWYREGAGDLRAASRDYGPVEGNVYTGFRSARSQP